MILEYAFGAATVAVGWSGYLQSLCALAGTPIPPVIAGAPFSRDVDPDDGEILTPSGSILNVPALAVIYFVSIAQLKGMKESALLNNSLVVLKVSILLLFIFATCGSIDTANWQPYVPPAQGRGTYGVLGIFRGASVVFFSYIGFDAVAAASSDAIDPQRALPIAAFASIGLSTVLFIATALVVTGLAPYSTLNVPDPIAVAVAAAGPSFQWLLPIVGVGAILGLTSVLLVTVLSGSHILYYMARDGNLPHVFALTVPGSQEPLMSTIIVGSISGVVAALVPLNVLSEMVSIGTLFVFAVVCIGVLVLRHTRPNLPRPFHAPWSPVTPLLGATLSLVQIAVLPVLTIVRVLVWAALGLVVWFAYARKHAAPFPLTSARLVGSLGEHSHGQGGVRAAATLSASASARELCDASKRGDVACVRECLQRGSDANGGAVVCPGNWLVAAFSLSAGVVTPLFVAAEAGHVEVVRALLAGGASPALECSGMSPLFIAAYAGRRDTVLALIEAGADAKAAMGNGTTPEHAARAGGHSKLAEEIAGKDAPPFVALRIPPSVVVDQKLEPAGAAAPVGD